MVVRTRFAPSPTGYLHIGSARTALFSYLYARHHGGVFILRVEDTDRERSTPESIEAIIEAMRWLQLEWDEGPFYQSKRWDLYREHAERLLRAGHAYRCYCTAELLDAKRKAAMVAGRKPMYDRTCRSSTARSDGPFTIRFKAPLDGETNIPDLVKGPVVVQNQELDDLVLVRSDGIPTYNFCAVVDDALMQVTHIIRGEDHLANTPKQIQLYRAFGYPMPAFAHIPLILGLDRARLSKRHGATSVTAYRDLGYLPDALINYLARLGWSYGDQEIFTRGELIEKFSLETVGKSAGVYNPEKLEWVNFQHLKAMPAAALAQAVKPFIAARGWPIPGDDTWLAGAVATLRERAKTLVELADSARFYLCDDVELEAKAAAKHLQPATAAPLRDLAGELAGLSQWNIDGLQQVFNAVMARHSLALGKLAQPVRVALTGGTTSPGIFEVLEVLGKERALARLGRGLEWAVAATGAATAVAARTS
ncbi:MAG: glutamate--tRNA ligase [Deltaproteobacteria bacterium]|nr:glutamate--tRNA ligase [Deltaproteobacteria bacterium]